MTAAPATRAAASPTVPLADVADRWLNELGDLPSSISGAALLAQRASLAGLRVPGSVSAGGGCRLYPTRDGVVALNLARPDDRTLLPALFETDDATDPARLIANGDAAALVTRGRGMGLAIAHAAERAPPVVTALVETPIADRPARAPQVLDLSALWAGPLATHLLSLLGADVSKIEARARPDTMRDGRDGRLHAALNAGKHTRMIEFTRDALLAEIAKADVVVEASRPRALLQIGVDADALVRARPGLTWISITGHGTEGDAANWIAFGDDAGVAGGLTAAFLRATGKVGFVGDAIADPLSGIQAAALAWQCWRTGRGGRYGLAMSGVAAAALAEARAENADAFEDELRAWAAAEGTPFAPPASC